MITTLRLVNGSKPSEGRLEVLHNGQWGTVCDRQATFGIARIACRELGYREAVEIKTGAFFGEGSGPVWMEPRYACDKRPIRIKTLSDCLEVPRIPGWGETDCTHSTDLGVVCSGVLMNGLHKDMDLYMHMHIHK